MLVRATPDMDTKDKNTTEEIHMDITVTMVPVMADTATATMVIQVLLQQRDIKGN